MLYAMPIGVLPLSSTRGTLKANRWNCGWLGCQYVNPNPFKLSPKKVYVSLYSKITASNNFHKGHTMIQGKVDIRWCTSLPLSLQYLGCPPSPHFFNTFSFFLESFSIGDVNRWIGNPTLPKPFHEICPEHRLN
jgi:hypothetical protein